MLKNITAIILILVCIFIIINGFSELDIFFNPYTFLMFIFILYSLTFIKFGWSKTLMSLKVLVDHGEEVSVETNIISKFQYYTSYSVSVICFIAGSIMILYNYDNQSTSSSELFKSIAVNLLVIFYASIFAEIFCKLKIKEGKI